MSLLCMRWMLRLNASGLYADASSTHEFRLVARTEVLVPDHYSHHNSLLAFAVQLMPIICRSAGKIPLIKKW